MLQLSVKVTALVALVLATGVAQLEYSSVKETSAEVDDFFPILACPLLMFFSSFLFPKEKLRISTASNKADIFQLKTCFVFHPTYSTRVFCFYRASFLFGLHSFFLVFFSFLQILLLEHVLMFTVLYCAMETESLIYPFWVMCYFYI